MNALRVLVVEDHQDTRDLYTEALEAAGCEVIGAWDREGALRLAHEREIDVATIDLGIKGGGAELAATLYEFIRPPALIAVTGRHPDEIEAREFFDRFLVKPVNPADLVAAVLELGESRRHDPSDNEKGRRRARRK